VTAAMKRDESRIVGRINGVGGRVYLHPGQYAAGDGLHTMTTILGSCIAVCLHDLVRRTGGLNHFLLPRAPKGEESARYGDLATRALIAALEEQGSKRHHLQARVIGGACVLEAFPENEASLGRANATIALDVLADAGIPVVMYDVGGSRGRRVTYHPATGDVLVKTL